MNTPCKTPCIGVCKTPGDVCIGCHRTKKEIAQWPNYSDDQRASIMAELRGEQSSHQCPLCSAKTQCDIESGKSTCWCFDIERRDSAGVTDSDVCLCRKCLSALPIL
ncbi:cysteine-rich CWC family protein [Vibrio sp. YMD68]|uniref:cysteine-rich CWC family protein n=1 Tax=Vibrio sp. YMD68 TaxID=3042300 RepID=UPI00249B9BAF|nr:cysteine-rich CWC family protein [Vibrio sp. YMD68]WGV98170.1 cysteine-rich CWC family protein [Vibrio sp. YMD68]